MKKLLIILILSMPLLLNAAKYVSPTGSDGAAGTYAAPYASLSHAWDNISAGDTIYLRGGDYTMTTEISLSGKSGTAGHMICVFNYANEKPVIKGGAMTYSSGWYTGLLITGDYLHFKGLEVTGYKQTEALSAYYIYGIQAHHINHCIFENLNVHHNGFGISIVGEFPNNTVTCTDNLILNCDCHHNSNQYGPSGKIWGGSDGITIRYLSTTSENTIRGCRLYWNSDDGFDGFYNAGLVTFENCWIWCNGYRPGLTPTDADQLTAGGDGQGLKLGPLSASPYTDYSAYTKRIIKNCVSCYNASSGFDQNYLAGKIIAYNNIGYKNSRGFNFKHLSSIPGDTDLHIVHILKNNISYDNTGAASPIGLISIESIVDSNSFVNISWQCTDNVHTDINNNDFVSLDSTQLLTARVSGALPTITFLHLKSGSDLIDAGTNVGLSYNGTAPDLGAFEYVAGVVIDPPTPKGTTVKVSGKVIKQNQIIRR